MTFFLKETPQADLTPRGPDRQPTSFWEGTGAAMLTEWRDSNIMFQRERQMAQEKVSRARPLADRVGIDALNQRAATDAEPGNIGKTAKTVDEFYAIHGETVASDIILQTARAGAKLKPDQWADVDLTEEGISKTVTERRIAEDRDEAEILAMSPRPLVSGLLGGTLAAMADPVNIAIGLATGGGGSFLRVLGREALFGAVAEVPSLPARLRTAEELGKPDPSIGETLAIGAIGGAALGGLFEGVSRGVRYYQNRQRVVVPSEVDGSFAQAAVGAAEDAIVAGDDPMAAVSEVMRRAPPEAGMGPLVLGTEQRVGGVSTTLAPDPITTTVLPDAPPRAPRRPPLISQPVTASEANDFLASLPDATQRPAPVTQRSEAPADAAKAIADAVKPKARASKVPKKPADIVSAIIARGGILKSSDRGDIAALDYRRPGLLRTEAFRSSSGGNNNGGQHIDMVREAMVERGYLPEGATIDDLISAIAETARGKPVFAQEDIAAAMDWQDYQKSLSENPDRTVVDDYLSMEPAPGGMFISENDLGFMEPADVAAQFDAYLEREGLNLFPGERAEILAELQARGGDAQYLIEQAMLREQDNIARTIDGGEDAYVPWGDEPDFTGAGPDQAVGSPDARPQTAAVDGAEAGARGAEPSGDPASPPAQALIPGTDRVQTADAQRAKAEMEARQLQSRIRRLDQTRVEDDASGLFATATADMFDDITSPQAAAYMTSQTANLRADLEAGLDLDGSVVTDDGRTITGLQGVLDELDDIDRMDAEFAACLSGKVTA